MTVTELFKEIHSLLDEQDPDKTNIEINVGYAATNISVMPTQLKVEGPPSAIRVEGWEQHKRISLAKST